MANLSADAQGQSTLLEVWGEEEGERGRVGRVGVGECEQTDRHAFLLAGLGFRNLLDRPGIDGSQAIFLSLNFLLADGCRRPV